MSYFVIRATEDGLRIEEMQEQTLLFRINPREDGDSYYNQIGFLEEVPKDDNWMSEENRNVLLVIEGEVIVPREVKTVTKYEL